MKPSQTRNITIQITAKKGGKYTMKSLRVLKRIFIDLKIEDKFDEIEYAKYSRFYMDEIIFQGKKELLCKEPNGIRFLQRISKFPYRKTKVRYKQLGRTLIVGNVTSYSQAIKIVGSLSKPSKIPTYGYALPITTCKSGSELAKQKGTICSGCYGDDGWYNMPWVRYAMEKRSIAVYDEYWTDAMIYLIKYHELDEFRWHDTGDIQSLEHLLKIVEVADRTPNVVYWLPTQENEIIEELWVLFGKQKLKEVVPNLKIRLSARDINKPPPFKLALKLGVFTSMVVTDDSDIGFNCPSSLQDNKCRECRNCWSNDFCVIYRKH